MRVVLWSSTYVRPGMDPVTKLLPSWQAVLEDLAREFPQAWWTWVAAQSGRGLVVDHAGFAEDFRPEAYGAVWHAEEHVVEL